MAWLMAPLVAFLVTAPIKHLDGSLSTKGAPRRGRRLLLSCRSHRTLGHDRQHAAQAAPTAPDGPILAAVAPHAGYPYSGPVAAWTYAALKGHKYSRVVVIAPSHFVGFNFTSVYDGDAYETPLRNHSRR
jgi:hypothetical protein